MIVNGMEITPEFVEKLKKLAAFSQEFNPFEVEISFVEEIREHFCETIMEHEKADVLRFAKFISGLTIVKNTLTELGEIMPLKPNANE